MTEAPVLDRDWSLARFFAKQLSGSALINRKNISIITILLTYRCPAACDHCVFESNPQNKTHLDMAVAYKLVEAAARQSPPPVLGFSGGEPFVRRAEMRALAAFAAERGMASEVVSSSAWVKSRTHAAEVLADLKSVGLETYCTSVDRFHTPFVKAEKMRWALQGAHDAGLRAIINFQVSGDSAPVTEEEAIRDVAGLLSMEESEVRTFQVNPLITTPVGRARTNVQNFHYDASKDMREGCPMATEVVTLSPLGLLYPCCGMVVGEKPERADLFIQDSLATRSVDEIAEILDDLKDDLFFKLLQYFGPYRILTELQRRVPGLKIADRYVGACDACLEFTTNPAIAQAAREMLAEFGTVLESLEMETLEVAAE